MAQFCTFFIQKWAVLGPATGYISIHMNDASVHCPIAYGSIAFWLGKKAEETQTHRWTLFVRGPHGILVARFSVFAFLEVFDAWCCCCLCIPVISSRASFEPTVPYFIGNCNDFPRLEEA